MRISRREFLNKTALVTAVAPVARNTLALPEGCWLEVLIPFVVQDSSRSFASEIVLPSSTFAGKEGYRSDRDFTEFEILTYDQTGQPFEPERIKLAPMHSRVVALDDFLGKKDLVGGARVRMRSNVAGMSHFGDLFSAAYVRWNMGRGFSYVHGYPDPPMLKKGTYLSILTLPRRTGHSLLSIFNPSGEPNEAEIEMYAATGEALHRGTCQISPFGTALFDLDRHREVKTPARFWEAPDAGRGGAEGTVVVSNPADRSRLFFFFVSGDGRSRFANEHPVLQGGFETIKSAADPFSSEGKFRAEGLVFSPLFFSDYTTRGLTLKSRAYLGAGRGIEDPQFLHPFISGDDGLIYWSSQHDESFPARAADRAVQGVLKLHPHQSYTVDSRELTLDPGFGGGLAVACKPVTSHTLMKIEIFVSEWDTRTYSHFRPGGSAARKLAEIEARQGVLSDYLISGIHIERDSDRWKRDTLLSVMNIEFEKGTVGRPVLELFGANGFVARRKLADFPSLACRFFWASELFPQAEVLEKAGGGPFSIRLMDESSISVLSGVHFDFSRKQLAVDHGSDRFSTYLSYSC